MSILDDAKQIADLIKKYNDQDLYERIVALREEILALREENIAVKEELRRTKEAASVADCYVQHYLTRAVLDNVVEVAPNGRVDSPAHVVLSFLI